jgi:hypothetical protein
MSFKNLIENECGGANPLMRLGQNLTSDVALKDEGTSEKFRDINFQPESVNATFDLLSFFKKCYHCDVYI